MGFVETIERARAVLERNGRLSLRALQREFELDHESLEDLVQELVDVQQIAAREGKVLSWIGSGPTVPSPPEPEAPSVLKASSEPPATLRLVRGIFIARDLGPHPLKGFAEPVAVHRVVRASGVRSRLDLAAGRLTPFVGREQEVELLLSRWEQVKEGHGQVVLVDGEHREVAPRAAPARAAGRGATQLARVLLLSLALMLREKPPC